MRRPLAAVLLAAALLAGCAGSDEPEIQTKDGYIADADGVCERLAQRFAEAGSTDPQTPEQVADAADVLADLYGDLLDGLQDVRLPSAAADRRGAAAYVAAVRSTNPRLAQLRTAADRFVAAAGGQDRRELAQAGVAVRKALDAFRAAQSRADTLAVGYGFNVCGDLN